MATTLQHIIRAIRQANLVPPSQVNYGVTDRLEPPYISVLDYRHELTYDTSGPVLKEAKYKVVVLAKDVDTAEALAGQVDDLINNNLTLTPQTTGSFQESYMVGQMAERLYQFGVEIEYSLKEDPNK